MKRLNKVAKRRIYMINMVTKQFPLGRQLVHLQSEVRLPSSVHDRGLGNNVILGPGNPEVNSHMTIA